MPNDRHTGRQSSRECRRIRYPNLRKKYVIVTDGEKTEENYLYGLRNSLDENTPVSVKIHSGVKTEKLIEKCDRIRSEDIFTDYNPARIWMVFDRDRVVDFDTIIEEAKRKNYDVAWSNPCIEEWFWAYFDELGLHTESVTTNDSFKVLFMTNTGRRYAKNMSDIYKLLRENGDEDQAIRRAENKLRFYERSGITNPSEMYSASTVFRLVKEWRIHENLGDGR